MRLCPQQLRGGVGSGDGDGWWTYRSLVVVGVLAGGGGVVPIPGGVLASPLLRFLLLLPPVAPLPF